MKNNLKSVCAALLIVAMMAATFAGCAKKIEYGTDGQDVYADNTAAQGGQNLSADVPTEPGTVFDSSNQGGSSYSGGGSSYNGGGSYNAGGSYQGNGGYAQSDNGNGYADAGYTSEITEKSTTTKRTVITTDARAVLNSARLKPTLTNDKELDDRVESILNKITNNSMSTYDKVVAIHNYIIDNGRYGYLMDKNPSVTYLSVYDRQVVAASKAFLKSWTGTCFDFAAGFMVLCRRIGLDCYKVKGEFIADKGAVTNHGWNIITINGVDYIFDVEADWRQSKPQEGKYADIYFCVISHWRMSCPRQDMYKKAYAGFACADFSKITLPANDIPEE